MDDACVVSVLQRFADLWNDCQCGFGIQLAGTDELPQVRSVYEFHDEEVKVFALPEVEHVDDRRVAEPRHRSCFASKTFGKGRVVAKIRSDQFYCDKSVELFLLCLIDNAHPASRDLVDNLEFRKQSCQLVEIPGLVCLS